MDRRGRYVHLWDRLNAIARIRAKEVTPEKIAADLGIALDEVQQWMFVHGEERNEAATTFQKHQQNTWGQ